VLRELDMLPGRTRGAAPREQVVARSSTWVRANASGILRSRAALGDEISKGQLLGLISDPLGELESRVLSSADGVLIGRVSLPLVHEGDAIFHIARVEDANVAAGIARQLRSARASSRSQRRSRALR
jgi:uncharacterized protein